MHLMKSLRLTLLLFTIGACSCAAAQASTGTLGHSGRFYTVDGQRTPLVGMDLQELAANPQVDYAWILDQLEAHDVRAVRMWIYPWWNTAYLQPWQYDVCGAGKYDLDSWNPAYWTKLKTVVDAAQARGIYVELSLFSANLFDDADWTSPRAPVAWNAAYNCNGEFAGNAAGTFVPQFWNPDPTGRLYLRQKQLIDKTLATFPYASYPSLSFEIANEFPGKNTLAGPSGSNSQLTNPALPQWQNGWIDYVKADNAGRIVSAHAQDYVGTNTNGIASYWSQPNVDTLNFHNTRGDGDSVEAMIAGGAQTKGKVIQDNETTTNQYGSAATTDVATQRAWAWNANLGYFKWYWDSAALAPTDPQFQPALQRLGVMYDIDREVGWTDLSDLDPSGNQYDSLASGGPAAHWKVLANPTARRYLYYGWGTNLDSPLEITLTAGTYLYKWVNPQDGSVLATGLRAADGGVTTIAQPSSWNTTAGLVLAAVPATKEACKDGGWQAFDNAFRNQGDCVSFVATGGRH